MLQNVINTALDEVKKDLIDSYESKGLRASGKYAQSLESFFTSDGSSIKFGILGAPHSEYMENGRSANVNQDKDSLKAFVGYAGSTYLAQWVKDKGLSISPFAVAWKISRQGIKVPNDHNKGGVISDMINRDLLDRFIGIIRNDEVVKLKTDIKNILA